MNVRNDKMKDFLDTIKWADKKAFFDKSIETKGDLSAYENAIWHGYLDVCRTFVSQSKMKKDDKTIGDLAKEMYAYIIGDKEFSHDIYCKILIDEYHMFYGQAQKIVNMAFKYLYCLAKEKNIKDRFDVCHMPLDRIMLEWIRRNVDTKLMKSKIETWSKMEKGSGYENCIKNDHYTYCYYQSILVEYCKEHNNICQLEIDFNNWREMTQILAAEEYCKQFREEEIKDDLPVKRLYEILKI